MSSDKIDYYKKYLKYKEKYLELKKTAEKLDVLRNNKMIGGGQEKLDLFLFKAEWCGHCKAFKPVWEELQQKFRTKYNFYTYDNEENKNEMKQWEIRGFPTIIGKRGDTATEYRGPRDFESLSAFFESL